MAEDEKPLVESVDDNEKRVAQLLDELQASDFIDDIDLAQDVNYLWMMWADFHVIITSPHFTNHPKPKIVEPGTDAKTGAPEDVYRIFDYNNKLCTSRAEDRFDSHTSTRKYLNTVEKICRMALARCNAHKDSGDSDYAPRVAFLGHEIGSRKGFETIVTLSEKASILNYNPGDWAEQHLKTIQELTKRGYGPPKISLGL